MKKLLVALLVMATAADAQTIASRRLRDNAANCIRVKLASGCTQADADAARAADPATIPVVTIYATDAAYRDGVIVPIVLAARQADDLNTFAAAVNRFFVLATPAQRTAVCSAAGLVC